MDPMIGAALISAAGGLLSGLGQGRISRDQINASLRQAFAQMGFSGEQFEEALRQANASEGVDVLQQTPNRVDWRQGQAINEALMRGARNYEVNSPIAGLQRFKPQISGGLRIPEGGFGPETLKFFSEEARLAGEQDLDRAGLTASDGLMPVPSYGSVYGVGGTNAEGVMTGLQSDLQRSAEKRRRMRDEALARAFGKDKSYAGFATSSAPGSYGPTGPAKREA